MTSANASLKSHAIRGIFSVAVASVLIRGGGLISQLIAGRILSSEEFGLFAVALGVSTFSVAASASLRPLLMERIAAGEDIDGLWRGCFWVVSSLSFALIVGADFVGDLINEQGAASVIRATAAAAPLQFFAVHGMARVAASLEFTRTSRILTKSAFFRHSSVIGLALAGFGVYSLVIPLFVEAVTQIALTTRSHGRPPSPFGSFFRSLRNNASKLKWVAFASLALSLAMTGDYATLSLFETTANVGVYFFAFQLTAAITQPFTLAATSVLVPSFANASTNDAVANSFFDAVRLQLAATGLAFGGLALVGGGALDIVWDGRWNAGSGVLVAIAIGTPLRMLNPLANALLQARGNFRAAGLLTMFNALLLVSSVVVGSALGSIGTVAVAASVSFLILGLVAVVVAASVTGRHAFEGVQSLVVGCIPTVIGLAVAFGLFPGTLVSVGTSAARAGVFVSIAAVLTILLLREPLRQVMTALRRST